MNEHLTPGFRDEIKNKEYRKLFKELKSSDAKLSRMYDDSRTATLKFKSTFNAIRDLENETEMKRERYYDMLAVKTYSEAIRDDYFENEKVLRDKKDLYIEQSQKLAHTNSQYVVCSDEFSAQREDYVKNLLKDVDRYYDSCENITKERDKFMHKSTNLKQQSDELRLSIKELSQQKQELETKEKELSFEKNKFKRLSSDLSNERDDLLTFKKKLENNITSLSNSNEKLTNERNLFKNSTKTLTQEVSENKKEEERLNTAILGMEIEKDNLNSEIKMYQDQTANLKKERDSLIKKTRELATNTEICRQNLTETEKQRDAFKEAFNKAKTDRDLMKENCDKMRKEKEKYKDEYEDLHKIRELVGREKDKMVSREYRARERNSDLIEAHKILSKELEETKIKLSNHDQRSKKDVKVKQELRDAIKRLKREFEEERRRWIKQTSDARTQTDDSLAFEMRDIAIQHAQFKMKQALRARDKSAKEKEKIKIDKERDSAVLKEYLRQLDHFKLREKRANEKSLRISGKLEDATRMLTAAKKEINKEKVRMLREERVKLTTREVIEHLEEELIKAQQRPDYHTASQQTNDVVVLDISQGDMVYEHTQKLQNSVVQLQENVVGLKGELSRNVNRKKDLHKLVEREKSANSVLRNKVDHIEGRYLEERNYVRAVRQSAVHNNLPFATIPTPPSQLYIENRSQAPDEAEKQTTIFEKQKEVSKPQHENIQQQKSDDQTVEKIALDSRTEKVKVQELRVTVPLSPRNNPLEGTSAGLLKRPVSDTVASKIAKRQSRGSKVTTTVTPLAFTPSPRSYKSPRMNDPMMSLPKSTKLYIKQVDVAC